MMSQAFPVEKREITMRDNDVNDGRHQAMRDMPKPLAVALILLPYAATVVLGAVCALWWLL